LGDTGMQSYHDDHLTNRIIFCVIRVHQTLGPGFLEAVYRRALVIELSKHNFTIEVEKEILVYYDGQKVGRHRLDLLIEGKVIVELKAVEALSKADYAQVRSYLKAAQLNLALLVNFSSERADFRRIEFLHPPIPISPISPS
jgi:GxxExxY protein